MSFTIQDARAEEATMIMNAVTMEDSEKLFTIANILEGNEEFEFANYVRTLAKGIERNIWAHDELRDNQN